MSYASEVQADSPSAWWRMNEASGLIQDSSGNGNHADTVVEGGGANVLTYGEPGAIVTEPTGKSIKFNASGGGGEYFRIPDAATLDLGNVFSIELWWKFESEGAAQWPLSKGTGAYEIRINASNQVELVKSESYIVVSSPALALDGSFYHIVAVRPGTNQGLIYVDGLDVSAGLASGSDFVDNATYVQISGVGDFYLDGWLDEIALYPTALSADRVRAHWNAGRSVRRSQDLDVDYAR